MNMPPFTTNTERLHVITALRSPLIQFPLEWPSNHRPNQRQVTTLLLQHDPNARPTAAELQRNDLLPKRMEEESINEALRLLGESIRLFLSRWCLIVAGRRRSEPRIASI